MREKLTNLGITIFVCKYRCKHLFRTCVKRTGEHLLNFAVGTRTEKLYPPWVANVSSGDFLFPQIQIALSPHCYVLSGPQGGLGASKTFKSWRVMSPGALGLPIPRSGFPGFLTLMTWRRTRWRHRRVQFSQHIIVLYLFKDQVYEYGRSTCC